MSDKSHLEPMRVSPLAAFILSKSEYWRSIKPGEWTSGSPNAFFNDHPVEIVREWNDV